MFARVRIEPERSRRLIRFVWHCSVVGWAGVGVLLIVAPWVDPVARRWIVGAAVAVYGFAAIANGSALRWRHYGWTLLALAGALALAGV